MKIINGILGVRLPLTGFAQQSVVTPVSAPTPAASIAQVVGTVSLGLNSTETALDSITVPISNADSQPLTILGVQTTGGLFVKDFPANIPAKGSAAMTLVFSGNPNSSGDTDLVRLLTGSGEKIIQVSHGRQQLVSVDTKSLSWNIGESGAKSVVITVQNGATMPKAVRAMGKGNSANIVFLGNGSFRINILPASTNVAQQFPVFVDLDPALPDVLVIINCSVGLGANQ